MNKPIQHSAKNDIEIATLIISSNTYPAKRNSDMQKKIFFEQDFDKNLTYWYKAGLETELLGSRFKTFENDLLINTDDGTTNMGLKTLMAFEWLEENKKYDFVVRPTPSSYLNYSNLYNHISTNFNDVEYVYSGKIQSTNDKTGSKINFVSGSTLILNRNTVLKVLKNKDLWDHSYWDDVALYMLLRELEITPQPFERYDIRGNAITENIPLNFYQYRCRADNHYNYPRFLETTNMKVVHKITNNLKIRKIEKFLLKLYYFFAKLFYIYQFGWKAYLIVRNVVKIILPQRIYSLIKLKFSKQIESFKHIRFKT